MKKRESFFDVLRGFAICLVVFAHCIQEGSGAAFSENALYFSDKIYQLIYSFHMPLFMLVSGYLCHGSMERAQGKAERRRLLKNRLMTLVLPVFLWTALDYARILLTNYINKTPQPEALVFVYFYNAFSNLWFLWALWWSFLAVYIVHYFFKDSAVVYAGGFLLLFVLPDGMGLGAYKYMLPYFIAAFYGHNSFDRLTRSLNAKNRALAAAAFCLCFAVLFCFFDEDAFIYLTGYKLVGRGSAYLAARQLATDVYRTAVGFAGSVFFALLWQGAARRFENSLIIRALSRLGRNSFGIYILSGYLIVFGVGRLVTAQTRMYLLNLLEAAAVLLISLALSELLGRLPLLKRLVGRID